MPAEITRANIAQSMGMGRKRKKTRFLQHPTDRWNRKYTVWIDLYSHQPVGLIEFNFTTPFVVPQKYCLVPEDAPWRMDLDLVRYARELKANLEDWEREVAQHGRKLYADRWDQVQKANLEEHGHLPTDVLARTGPRPLSPALPILMLHGDPFLLGFTNKPTKAVVKADPNFVREYEERLRREKRAQLGSKNPRKQAVPEDLMLSEELQELVEGTTPIRDTMFQDEEDRRRAIYERRMALLRAQEEADEDTELTGADAEDQIDEELEDGVNYAGVTTGHEGAEDLDDDDSDLTG